MGKENYTRWEWTWVLNLETPYLFWLGSFWFIVLFQEKYAWGPEIRARAGNIEVSTISS